MKCILTSLFITYCIVGYTSTAKAEIIGATSTEFKMLGSNSKIVIEAFDDPGVPGVTCYVSYPTKGGVKGSLGLEEERSETSIACRQTGPIAMPVKLKDGEDIFSKSRSLLFKKMHVLRYIDKKRNVLVYLVYTDKLIDGSPKHNISSVPVMPWSNR
ncbi:MAG: CreA family protein [Desulfuromonadaceae bacterium]